MHPYGKLHKPLRLLAVLFTLMIISRVDCEDLSQCSNGIRTFNLYAKNNGYVRTSGRKVIASASSEDADNLQQITIDNVKFLLFNPREDRFICWNRTYKRLVAMRKLTSDDIRCYCKFWETSIAKSHIGLETQVCDRHGNFISSNKSVMLSNFRKNPGSRPIRHERRLPLGFLKMENDSVNSTCKRTYQIFCNTMMKWERKEPNGLPIEIQNLCKRYRTRKHLTRHKHHVQ